MWILNKPSIEDAINDISKIAKIHKKKQLNNNEQTLLALIYRKYDRNNGHITAADSNLISATKQEYIQSFYEDTYKNKPLKFIREELKKGVFRCPICGISEPAQLDHVYPQQQNKVLAVCRLNLVPECGPCNLIKRDKDPNLFIHPYYNPQLKGKEIFIIKFQVIHHTISWKIEINQNALSQTDYNSTKRQLEEIELKPRLYRETSYLLANVLCRKDNWNDMKVFAAVVKQKYEESLYSRDVNDWQTAFYKGLLEAVNQNIITFEVLAQYVSRKELSCC